MVERQTAIKVSLKLLLDGEYIQKEGWEPNFVRTAVGEVSRANVMGVITQETEPGMYVLDDGSGNIQGPFIFTRRVDGIGTEENRLARWKSTYGIGKQPCP